MAGFDSAVHSSANRELAPHHSPNWIARCHNVSQNAINRILIENSQITITENVVLKRLKLQTDLVGQVMNRDLPKIGQLGLRANRSEFRHLDSDLIPAELVRPDLDCWQFSVNARPR